MEMRKNIQIAAPTLHLGGVFTMLFCLLLQTGFLQAQNSENNARSWRMDGHADFGTTWSKTKDLGVIPLYSNDDRMQGRLCNIAIRYTAKKVSPISTLNTGVGIGLGMSYQTYGNVWNNRRTLEKINVGIYGISTGYSVELSRLTSVDFNLLVGLGVYQNEISGQTQASFDNYGFASAGSLAFYFSPAKYLQIGLGLQNNWHLFKDKQITSDSGLTYRSLSEHLIVNSGIFASLKFSL